MKKLLFIAIVAFFSTVGYSAEILVKAVDSDDPQGYKRGMPVVVMNDGHAWGNGERYPAFVVIKVPMIPKATLFKYIQELRDGDSIVLIRLWRIQWNELPAGAKTKIATNGFLVIKATALYTGTYDYTWAQIRIYLLNYQTGLYEDGDL